MSDSIWLRFKVSVAALAVATLAILPTPAHAGPIDLVRKLTPSASAQLATPNAAGAGALKKFTAIGPVNETLDNGVCPNSYAATVCTTPSDCIEVPITGSLTATSLGKSSFSGCLTVNNDSPDTPLADCFSGLGTGTITAKNGNSVVIAFGGNLCIADAFPLPTPTNAIFTLNSSYAVESGTGPYASAAGSGNLSASLIITNVGTPPFAGSGTLNLTGSFAK
ncbi:MAG: hypothetical protein WA836_18680 [Candidatus Binataceae bacterium]